MSNVRLRCNSLMISIAALLVSGSPVAACSVCFGDPDSAMAQGALVGVYVLGGVIGLVLFGVAGTALFWAQRSRRLGRPSDGEVVRNR